ncbi:uncharacterized protein LOC110275369 isoform X2 [Arachis duranensis]|uniref:Uncharacterized protein LOC110275369 isoform X2 n=1 Tax=Arachis duranensis TaxID=130453 RepID=A0A9C6T694_ARADU|nr:uncharacterized protein LOC110275369 isoform X2 [Arachis duranensis]
MLDPLPALRSALSLLCWGRSPASPRFVKACGVAAGVTARGEELAPPQFCCVLYRRCWRGSPELLMLISFRMKLMLMQLQLSAAHIQRFVLFHSSLLQPSSPFILELPVWSLRSLGTNLNKYLVM